MLVHEFSELPGLQKAGGIRYSLAQGDAGLCLCAVRLPSAAAGVRCPLPGLTRRTAENLLRYLYEHAVDPACVPDILADCLQGAVARG